MAGGHLVGFSLGGGVALEMIRADPARAASLRVLSAIRVREHEILGEYHLNHAIHGLQLLAIWAPCHGWSRPRWRRSGCSCRCSERGGGGASWPAGGRLRRWEFWPPWLFYLPVLAWRVWPAARYRSLTVFTAANPAFPDGGLVGESGSEILGMVGNRERGARTAAAGAGEGVAAVGGLPVVVKPDVGERGSRSCGAKGSYGRASPRAAGG